jgi:arylsulfatase A-like enzyme
LRERLTRKDFLKVAGAGVASAAVLGAAGCGTLAKSFTQVPDEYLPKGGSKVNVIVVVLDSLRRDHVGAYGNGWIKTPNLDALAKQSLLFTRSYPESIPIIPARRAIHTGVRTSPFRDWHLVSDDATGKPYLALYPELTDTVFMMRHPGGRGAGTRSDYYASTDDVAPTILSMLGIEKPEQMEGTDLSPIFEGEEPDQRRESTSPSSTTTACGRGTSAT